MRPRTSVPAQALPSSFSLSVRVRALGSMPQCPQNWQCAHTLSRPSLLAGPTIPFGCFPLPIHSQGIIEKYSRFLFQYGMLEFFYR